MSYSENMYKCLLKKAHLVNKYKHAGIYSISIDDELVYIGKSNNMLKRIAQHMVGIKTMSEKKYCILADSKNQGHTIEFDVLYYAKSKKHKDLEEELGQKEGELIRQHMPMLNTQIPKEENQRSYVCREIVDKLS